MPLKQMKIRTNSFGDYNEHFHIFENKFKQLNENTQVKHDIQFHLSIRLSQTIYCYRRIFSEFAIKKQFKSNSI